MVFEDKCMRKARNSGALIKKVLTLYIMDDASVNNTAWLENYLSLVWNNIRCEWYTKFLGRRELKRFGEVW